MLPDNNLIIVRVEFPQAPLPPTQEGAEPAALPPHLKEGAEKVQGAAEGTSFIPKGKEKVYPTLDPLRLMPNPKEKEGNKKVLEKLLHLIPLKLPEAFQQQPVKKTEKQEIAPGENKVPVSKETTAAKGQALGADQKHVTEEIEGVARTQEDHRLERKQTLFAPPKSVKEEKPKGELPLKERGIAKEEIPSLQTQELEKPVFRELGQSKKNSEDAKPPLKGERVQVGAQAIPLQPASVPPFPKPFIADQKIQNLPEHKEKHVEEVARVEAIQPIQQEIPFKLERNDPASGILPIHADDRDIVRIPLNPDLPLTRQNLFKREHRGSQGWQEDEGHAVGDMIHMLLCAFICGANDLPEAWRYLEAHSAHYQKWLNLKKGIPSYRLLALFLARLTPAALEKLLLAVTGQGETLHALQRLRLWETDRGILAAQSENEIHKNHPREVVDLFDIQNSIVQLDLPRLNPSLANAIHAKQGRYLHRVKPSDDPLYQQLLGGFKETADFRDVREMTRTTELREITVQETGQTGWDGLKAAVRFNSELLTGSKHWVESRVYLTDMPSDPKRLAQTLRTFSLPSWIEWTADFDFTDWSCNHAEGHAGRFRQFAWQLLERQGKSPLELRKKAQTNIQLLAQIIRFA